MQIANDRNSRLYGVQREGWPAWRKTFARATGSQGSDYFSLQFSSRNGGVLDGPWSCLPEDRELLDRRHRVYYTARHDLIHAIDRSAIVCGTANTID